MIICACYDDNIYRVADLDTRLNDCNSSKLNIQWNISRELPFHRIWELWWCWIDLIACLAAPPSVVPSPRSHGQFLSSCVFPLILLCCLRTIRTTRRVSIQNLESTNWENIQPHTDRWLSCPSTLVSSVTVKNWPKFFSFWTPRSRWCESFLFLLSFCLCICRFSRRYQKSSVREKCRKTWVADESLTVCMWPSAV